MELSDYWKILMRSLWLLIGIPVIFVILVWLSFKTKPYNYNGSVTFTLTNKSVPVPSSYSYDNYYTLAASASLADSVANWFSSPTIINQIYQSANIELPTHRLSSVGKLIKSSKASATSSVVIVTLSAEDHQSAEALTRATAKVITNQVNILKTTGSLGGDLSIIASDPIVLDEKRFSIISIITAGFAGLFLSIVVILLFSGLKQNAVSRGV